MPDIDQIERLSMIYAYLFSSDTKKTIDAMADRLPYPLSVLRSDMALLMTSPLTGETFYFSDEDMMPSERDAFAWSTAAITEKYGLACGGTLSEILDAVELGNISVKYLKIMIVDGVFDLVTVCVVPHSYNIPKYACMLPLTRVQLDIAGPLFPEYVLPGSDPLFEVKRISRNVNPLILQTINSAILDHRGISFSYENAAGKRTVGLKCNPVMLRFDGQNGTIYCINDKSHIFRVDRMSRVREMKGSAPDDGSESFNNDFDRLWAMPDNDATVYHIVCRIRPNGIRNIISKIRSDIRRRKTASLTLQEDGSYIYEDEVVGLYSFIPWLRSYGSNIEVLEPEFLARKLYEEALEKLKKFQT